MPNWFEKKSPIPVKCQNCGFLALRHPDTLELVSPTVLYRSEGFDRLVIGGEETELSRVPHCFTHEYPIHNERMEAGGAGLELVGEAPGPFSLGSAAEGDVTDRVILSVISRDRICSGFYQWHDTFSPKEHYEMRERDRWQDWEAKQRRSDRAWRLIELLAFIVAGGVTAIVAAMIERGSWF